MTRSFLVWCLAFLAPIFGFGFSVMIWVPEIGLSLIQKLTISTGSFFGGVTATAFWIHLLEEEAAG